MQLAMFSSLHTVIGFVCCALAKIIGGVVVMDPPVKEVTATNNGVDNFIVGVLACC